PTFLVTPARGRVVAAKLAAAALAGLAVALGAPVVVLGIALPWPPRTRGRGVRVPRAAPGLAARLVGLAAAVALSGVLGTGLGALFRNQYAAVVAGLLLWQGGVEGLIVGVLGRPGLGRWLPQGATAGPTAPGDASLTTWAGALVLAAYGLALSVVGGRLVMSRDLT